MPKYINSAALLLAIGLTQDATTLEPRPGWQARFPTEYPYFLTLRSSEGREIVKVTASDGQTLTVERGQGGSSARAWSPGALAQLRPTTEALEEAMQKGVHRTISYDPNNTLDAAYPGEMVLQLDVSWAKTRWWRATHVWQEWVVAYGLRDDQDPGGGGGNNGNGGVNGNG